MVVSRAGLGPLRDRVAFDAPVIVPDGSGGTETQWSEQFKRFAAFIYQRGSESVEAGRLTGVSNFKVRLISSSGTRAITTDWRMRDVLRQVNDSGGRPVRGVFNIVEVDLVTDRRWVWLVVEGGVAT